MKIEGLTPILNVSNIVQTFEWFAKLGWEKAWTGLQMEMGRQRSAPWATANRRSFFVRVGKDRAADQCHNSSATTRPAAFG